MTAICSHVCLTFVSPLSRKSATAARLSCQVMAKKLDRRLEGLGARALLERGLGDDQVRHRPTACAPPPPHARVTAAPAPPAASVSPACLTCIYLFPPACLPACLPAVYVHVLQHPSGFEAALDPWLTRLWPALRVVSPLPAGVPEVGSGGMQGQGAGPRSHHVVAEFGILGLGPVSLWM